MGEQEPSRGGEGASSERPYPEGTSNVERVEHPPLWTLWLKPGRFHAWAAHAMPAEAFAPIVFIVLVSRTAQRLDTMTMQGRLPDGLNNWRVFWFVSVLIPLLLGVLSYFWYGFFYWLRLRISGVEGKVFHKGTRIYFASSLIRDVPTLLLLAFATVRFESPVGSWTSEDPVDLINLLVLPFLFWAVVSSYLGVRSAFRPCRPIAALILFLILPIAFYAAAVPLVFWISSLGYMAPEARLEQPLQHEGAAIAFAYPSNWTIDKSWHAHDHDRSVYLLTGADASIWMQTYWYEGTPGEALAETRERMAEDQRTFRGELTEGSVASIQGGIWKGTLTLDGTPYLLEQFAAAPRDDGWFFEIMYLAHPNADEKLRPGFNLILDSLEITHPHDQPAVTERTREYDAAGLSFGYPNNWVASADLEASEEDPALDVGGITVDAPERSYASMLLYYSANSLQSEIDITVDQLVEEGGAVEDDEPIDSIGPVTGEGLRFRLVYDEENAWICRVLVTRLPDERVLELREYTPVDRIKRDKNGFALIWRTLEVPGQVVTE